MENNGAIFNEEANHRLCLWRGWDESKPPIMFIGLNPSKATETEDDPTIRRVVGFAKAWGYGKVYMMNLFTYITTKPSNLILDDDVYDFKYMLSRTFEENKCEEVVFAWGNFDIAKERAAEVMKLFPQASALQINKNGSSKHPLYVKADIKRVYYHHAIKEDVCLQTCTGCDIETDIETMTDDSDSNWFCQPCWTELGPIMQAEYEELVKKGEIDPEE